MRALLPNPAWSPPPAARRMRRFRRGISMIELLVGLVLALLTGAALVQLQLAHYTAFSVVSGQNFVNANTRQPLDVLSDTLRNAQSVQNGGVYQALVAASASDVVCFADNSSTVEIYLDTSTTPSTLRRVKKTRPARSWQTKRLSRACSRFKSRIIRLPQARIRPMPARGRQAPIPTPTCPTSARRIFAPLSPSTAKRVL